MPGKRKWKLLSLLAIPPVVIVAIATWTGISTNQNDRRTFDNLREGMNVTEASIVLGRDLQAAGIIGSGFECYSSFETAALIIPTHATVLCFGDGKLIQKTWHGQNFLSICSALTHRPRRFVSKLIRPLMS